MQTARTVSIRSVSFSKDDIILRNRPASYPAWRGTQLAIANANGHSTIMSNLDESPVSPISANGDESMLNGENGVHQPQTNGSVIPDHRLIIGVDFGTTYSG